MNKLDNFLSILVGLMSIFIVIYRIVKFMIPLLLQGIKEKNYNKIFQSFTQLV